MTEELLEKLNQHLEHNALFYVSNDPERALGLEDRLKNYHICHIDLTHFLEYFESKGIAYFCLDRELEVQNSEFRSSVKLARHELFNNYVAANSGNINYFQTFKISPSFEKTTQEMNARLVNPVSGLNRKFENKLSQFRILEQLQLTLPKTILLRLDKADYHALVKELGPNFVLQFNRGHTGTSTHLIGSLAAMDAIKSNYPNREAKFSQFIPGNIYTINACVTKHGIAMGGLSYQITGIKGLTDSAGATVGNDWHYRPDISPEVENKILSSVTKIGKRMQQEGYLGLFGIDLIVNTNDVYIIEINARQPASIPMYTKMQLQQGQVPLALLNLLEFTGIEYQLELDTYNKENMSSYGYSQIFIRAGRQVKVQQNIETGIYRLLSDNSAIDRPTGEVVENTIFLDEDQDKPLVYQGEGYTISDITEEKSGMLMLTQPNGREIKSGQELARIQVGQGVVTDGKLAAWVIEALTAVKQKMI